MSGIKKRQHYVWRNYLRAWASRESIWTFFKQQNKVLRSNLMGVAQEKYFYKLVDVSEEEEFYLKKFFDWFCDPTVKGWCMDFLFMFTSHGKLRKRLEENTNPRLDKKSLEDEIRKLEINLMEDVHSKFELDGQDLIKVRTTKDLELLKSGESFYTSMIYLCVQYCRTSLMKKSVLNTCKRNGAHELLAEKFWNIMSFPFALNVAKNISLNPKIKFTIYTAVDGASLITGDQPVFNLKSDILNTEGNVMELEFYYPLSPTHALLIQFEENGDRFNHINLSIDRLNFLNSKVVEMSDLFVFSDNESQLKSLVH